MITLHLSRLVWGVFAALGLLLIVPSRVWAQSVPIEVSLMPVPGTSVQGVLLRTFFSRGNFSWYRIQGDVLQIFFLVSPFKIRPAESFVFEIRADSRFCIQGQSCSGIARSVEVYGVLDLPSDGRPTCTLPRLGEAFPSCLTANPLPFLIRPVVRRTAFSTRDGSWTMHASAFELSGYSMRQYSSELMEIRRFFVVGGSASGSFGFSVDSMPIRTAFRRLSTPVACEVFGGQPTRCDNWYVDVSAHEAILGLWPVKLLRIRGQPGSSGEDDRIRWLLPELSRFVVFEAGFPVRWLEVGLCRDTDRFLSPTAVGPRPQRCDLRTEGGFSGTLECSFRHCRMTLNTERERVLRDFSRDEISQTHWYQPAKFEDGEWVAEPFALRVADLPDPRTPGCQPRPGFPCPPPPRLPPE